MVCCLHVKAAASAVPQSEVGNRPSALSRCRQYLITNDRNQEKWNLRLCNMGLFLLQAFSQICSSCWIVYFIPSLTLSILPTSSKSKCYTQLIEIKAPHHNSSTEQFSSYIELKFI
jgi:hypothetical protein